METIYNWTTYSQAQKITGTFILGMQRAHAALDDQPNDDTTHTMAMASAALIITNAALSMAAWKTRRRNKSQGQENQVKHDPEDGQIVRLIMLPTSNAQPARNLIRVGTQRRWPHQDTRVHQIAAVIDKEHEKTGPSTDRKISSGQKNVLRRLPSHPTQHSITASPPPSPASSSRSLRSTRHERPRPYQKPPNPPIDASIKDGVCWKKYPPFPGARLGRILIWKKYGNTWKLILVAAESRHLLDLGHKEQWGLYRAWESEGGIDAGFGVKRTLGLYQGKVIGPPFESAEKAGEWSEEHLKNQSAYVLACFRDKHWRLIDGSNQEGLHLHLINDPRGSMLPNTWFTTNGMVETEGDVRYLSYSNRRYGQ